MFSASLPAGYCGPAAGLPILPTSSIAQLGGLARDASRLEGEVVARAKRVRRSFSSAPHPAPHPSAGRGEEDVGRTASNIPTPLLRSLAIYSAARSCARTSS